MSHPKTHHYETSIRWTGNTGNGTTGYSAYTRAHEISAEGKPVILASSDPSFRGDPAKYNPEELFVAALSSCHMLWYLHLCAVNGVIVTHYEDKPLGTMVEAPDGSGSFSEIILKPRVVVSDKSMVEKSIALHEKAGKMCFIANSVKCEIRHEPESGVEVL